MTTTTEEAEALDKRDRVMQLVATYLRPDAGASHVLGELRALLFCPEEGHGALTAFCARCRGAAGGAKKTPAKKKALQASLKKARRQRWKD